MFKKLLLGVAVSSLLIGCLPQKSLYSAFSSRIDYKEYADVGFYITESNSVNFEYTPISSLVASVKSGYTSGLKPHNSKVKMIQSEKEGPYVEATSSVVLEELYQEAIKLGANGIINLKIVATIEDGTSEKGVAMARPVYVATGMAIKR